MKPERLPNIDDAKVAESLRQLLQEIAASGIPALKTRLAAAALEIWTRKAKIGFSG